MTGTQRFSSPFDGDNTNYVLEEDFLQFLGSYSSPTLSTTHAAPLASYFLVKEGPLSPTGVSDVVKWTRTWAQVPASRSEPTSTAYQFIGYSGYLAAVGGSITATVPGRKRFTKSVTARIQYDYFLYGPGQTYTTFNAIPVIQSQKYYFRIGSITPGPTWTQTYPAGSNDDLAQGSATDYLCDFTGPYQITVIPCVPSRTQYMALLATGTPLPYQSGTGCLTGEIVAEDSKLSRWMGNIAVRSTTYVIAQ